MQFSLINILLLNHISFKYFFCAAATEVRVIESAMQTIAFVSCIRFRVNRYKIIQTIIQIVLTT